MLRRCCWASALPIEPIDAPITPAGLPAHALWPYGREAWSMAFLSTPGTERLYSGVTNSTPSEALMAAFSRLTGSAWLASSSWLYSGRSAISANLKVTSDGASLTSASASWRLNDSRRRLPTTTRIWLIKGSGEGMAWDG